MGRLQVDRHTVNYSVVASAATIDSVRNRLDAVLRARLPDRLGNALDAILDPQDPRIVIIRRLEIDLTLDGSGPEDVLCDRWAARIASAIKVAVTERTPDVCVFENEAHLLQEFLEETAEGRSKEAWLFPHFRGLAMLPVSTALRTALLDDPLVGERALLRMSPASRAGVLSVMSDMDLRRVLVDLIPDAQDEPTLEELEQALLWAAEESSPERPATALRVYLRMREAVPEGSPARMYAAVEAALAFFQLVADLPRGELDRVIERIGRRDVGALALLTDVESAQAMVRLSPLGNSALRDAVRRPDAFAAPSVDPTATVFGGAFLLLENLSELPFEEWTRGWPGIEGFSADRLLRWLVLVQAMGSDRSYEVARDPLLRRLLQVPISVDRYALRSWGRRIANPRLDRLRWELFQWQMLRERLSGQTLAAAGVIVDTACGLWVPDQGQPADGEREETRETLSRLHFAAGDLRYLRLDARLGISRRLASALAPVTMTVLRGFAWRLPGFGRANLEHLSRNFLSCAAMAVPVEDAWQVTISRPPLDLIVRMTGLGRGTLRLDWTEPSEIHLSMGGAGR